MKQDVWRVLIHLPVGAFNAWLLGHSPAAGAVFFVAFLVYEINEDWRICDQAWKDIKGYLWGFAVAAYLLAFF